MSCPRTPLEERVLARIKPSEAERRLAERVWRTVRERLEYYLSSRGIEAEVTLQGSLAKDTWLSGELDVDVFVLFPRDWRNRLDEAKDLFREAFHDYVVEERHAAHPYIRVLVEGVWVDVVPALRVGSGAEAETAVDRTPFHTRYVVESLSPEQRDEVRLLKRFLKGIGVYGAEIAVQGFSGYAAELLVIAYRCFRYVLEKASRWAPPVIIDPEGHYGGSIARIRERFGDHHIVIVDPVDPRRNVTAAVSKQSMAWFTLASRLYLREPSEAYYWPPPYPDEPLAALREAGPRAWSILAARYEFEPGTPPDVAWGALRAAARRYESIAAEQGLRVVHSDVYYCEDGRVGLLLAEHENLSDVLFVPHRGPQAWLEERPERFIKRVFERGDPGPWIDEDVLYSLRSRRVKLRSYAERAKPKKARLTGAWLLGDAVLEGELNTLCVEARRAVYRFVVKRPEWLDAVMRGRRSCRTLREQR